MDYFQNTTFAPASKSLFNRQLNTWVSYLPKTQQNIINILMFPENSVKLLKDNIKTNSNANLHTFYTAVIAVITHSPDFTSHIPTKQLNDIHQIWREIRRLNQIPIAERRNQKLPTELQIQKGGVYLKYDDIIKKRDSLPFGSIQRLLLGFYTYLYPVRADYFATEIITFKEKPTKPNYIRRVSPTESWIVINDFKTKHTYKQIKNRLPPELNNELVESLRINPRKYLFVDQIGRPFTRNAFTLWSSRHLKRVFNTELTLTIIRHLFINSLNMTDMSIEQRQEISSKMGHDLWTQEKYQWDLDDSD